MKELWTLALATWRKSRYLEEEEKERKKEPSIDGTDREL